MIVVRLWPTKLRDRLWSHENKMKYHKNPGYLLPPKNFKYQQIVNVLCGWVLSLVTSMVCFRKQQMARNPKLEIPRLNVDVWPPIPPTSKPHTKAPVPGRPARRCPQGGGGQALQEASKEPSQVCDMIAESMRESNRSVTQELIMASVLRVLERETKIQWQEMTGNGILRIT